MPRPGPRPYECIRRAWHSESHQALRGGLTQEIFRIVTEFHRPDTRCKKEWQEKLPIVVLRAEEILYSKARTEAEYADLSTLKERLNDAVNTMIRRTDESREKEAASQGPFMEPCVEAALSLGCVPKMNPRGLRSCSARIGHSSSSSSMRRTATTTTTTTNILPCSSSSSSSSGSAQCPSPSSSSFSSSSAAASVATASTTASTGHTASCITTSSTPPPHQHQHQPQALAFLSLESTSSWPQPRSTLPPQVHPAPITSVADPPMSKNRPPCFGTMVNNPNINFSVTPGAESHKQQQHHQQHQQHHQQHQQHHQQHQHHHHQQQQQRQQQNLGYLAPSYPPSVPHTGGCASFRMQSDQLPAFSGSDLNYLPNHTQQQQQQQQRQKFQHHRHHPPFPTLGMVYLPQVQVAPPRHPTTLPVVFPPPSSLEPAHTTSMQARVSPAIPPRQEEHDLDLCLAPPKTPASRSPCNADDTGRHFGLRDPTADDILSSNAAAVKKAKIVRPL